MKALLESIIKMRNSSFAFHESISTAMLAEFCLTKSIELLRSLKLLYYGTIPKYVFIGKCVQFQYGWKIKIGRFVKLDNYCLLSALGDEGLLIGNNTGIGAYSRLIISTTFQNPGKYIRIGNNVGIGEYAYLGGAGGLEIKDGCIIGQYFSCHPENHVYEDLTIDIRYQPTTRKGISIGENCWIGSKVTILDGVTIGKGCVIAAGAVVNKSFPDNSVIGGVPAKLIKSRISK